MRAINVSLGLAVIMLLFLGFTPPRDVCEGTTAGKERTIGGIKLCWCPPGKFKMGSPPGEPDRRPGETQVEVTLTRGFWIGKYEVTQGDWKRVIGKLPGELTTECSAGQRFGFDSSPNVDTTISDSGSWRSGVNFRSVRELRLQKLVATIERCFEIIDVNS